MITLKSGVIKMGSKKKTIFVWFILLVLAIFLYYPIFNAHYVWDDTLLFVMNQRLIDSKLTWESVSVPILPGTSYLRPLVLASWWAEFQIFGLNSSVSHIIGFIIYFFNVILVYLLTYHLAKRVVPQRNIIAMASIASLLYLVHPALIETTAWVSGRFDQFVTLFTLLSCLIFVIGSDKARFSIFASILLGGTFFAALLSKELGIVLPGILVCLYFVLENSKASYTSLFLLALSKYRYACMSLLIVLFFYLALRTNTIAGIYHEPFNWVYVQEKWIGELLPLYAYSDYWKQAFLPFYSISALHPLENYDFFSWKWISLVVIAIISFITMFYFAFVRRSIIAWLFVASFISIFLVLHFIPLTIMNNLIHERFMTQALAFLAIAMVFIPYKDFLTKLGFSQRLVNLGLGLVVLVWLTLSLMTVKSIVPMWYSDYTLWHWQYKTYPDDKFAQYNYWYAVGQYKGKKEVIKLIDNYYKGKSMEVSDQVLYAEAKLSLDDPESLMYYQGIVVSLPKLHEPNPNETYQKYVNYGAYGLTYDSLGFSYVGNAIAHLYYKGDIKTAEENLNVAEYYQHNGDNSELRAHQVAVLYLKGEYNSAITFYEDLKQKNASKRYTAIVNKHIDYFCNKYPEKSVSCAEYLKNNPFK